MSISPSIADTASEHSEERDLELLRSVASRDQRALEQLYRLYRRPLTQFLWRLQGGGGSVDEAINDTFWVVWRQAHRFRGDSRVSTWITGIAWRCAMSALRRNTHERTASGPAAEAQMLLATAEMAPQELEDRDQWLAHGLASLPLEQRATLELAYFLGHSCVEIAQIMECPVNTVKARMFQARLKLRNLLPTLDGSTGQTQSGGS